MNVMIRAKMIAIRITVTILLEVTLVLVHMDTKVMAEKMGLVVILFLETNLT